MKDVGVIVGIVSAITALIAARYAYKAYLAGKSPKLVIEAPYNDSLHLRNIGTDTARNIRETTGMFRDVPPELWNFNGPIDYIRIKSPSMARMINFYDEKRIEPASATTVCFEYENSDGDKFCSRIKIERGPATQQLYFNIPILIEWGKS